MQSDDARNAVKDRILVVDDDEAIQEMLTFLLEDEGYEMSFARSAQELRTALEAPHQADVVLLDWKLPDGDGIELLEVVKKRWPDSQVIMLTGHGTFDAAVEAGKRGAFHFVAKPYDAQTLKLTVRRASEYKHAQDSAQFMQKRAERLQETVSKLRGGDSPIFKSAAMKTVLRLVERVAPSDASMLITGESGTGKEVIADLIHDLSRRADGPLVKINCAALPRELIESELFGAVRGAYTGAHADREGLFRQAEGGTILLDEISEMPLDTQSKLLRVLQDKEFRPVGGKTSSKADCRVIASTNRRPEDAIKDNKLREDLFYRISAIAIHLPPLRERREDILPLAHLFLKRFAAQAARNINGFTQEASNALQRYDWPGNVRQLENEVQRAVLVCEGDVVDAQDLACTRLVATAGAPESSNLAGLEAMERNAIITALERTGGNKAAAARELGVTRQTLYNKMKHYGLNP